MGTREFYGWLASCSNTGIRNLGLMVGVVYDSHGAVGRKGNMENTSFNRNTLWSTQPGLFFWVSEWIFL